LTSSFGRGSVNGPAGEKKVRDGREEGCSSIRGAAPAVAFSKKGLLPCIVDIQEKKRGELLGGSKAVPGCRRTRNQGVVRKSP